MKNWQLICLIILILLPLFLLRLGQSSLWDTDEGVYAEISREMVLRNDYINTYYNYAPRFDKPPLMFWVTAFFYQLFGVSEYTTRTGVVLFGILNIILIYYFTLKLFNKRTALLSALIMGTGFQFLIQSRIFYMDIPLTFFIMLSLYTFYTGYHDNRRYYLLMGIAMGLGTLVKGPVALILPGVIVFFYLGPKGFFREFKSIWTWLTFLLYLVVALPWHILQWSSFGDRFTGGLFGYHMFKRFLTPIESHGAPIYYYILIIILGLLPWSAFIPWIYSIIKEKWTQKKDTFNLLIIWFSVVFVFFSIARTKLPGYILPVYPVFSMLIAYRWDQVLKQEYKKARFIIPSILIMISGLLILGGLLAIKPQVESQLMEYLELYKLLFSLPIFFICSAVLSLLFIFFIKKPSHIFVVFLTVAYFSMLFIIIYFVPAVDKYKPARPLALSITDQNLADVNIGSSLQYDPASLVFYLKKKVYYMKTNEEVKAFIKEHPRAYLFLDLDDYLELNKEFTLKEHYHFQNMLVVKTF